MKIFPITTSHLTWCECCTKSMLSDKPLSHGSVYQRGLTILKDQCPCVCIHTGSQNLRRLSAHYFTHRRQLVQLSLTGLTDTSVSLRIKDGKHFEHYGIKCTFCPHKLHYLYCNMECFSCLKCVNLIHSTTNYTANILYIYLYLQGLK